MKCKTRFKEFLSGSQEPEGIASVQLLTELQGCYINPKEALNK